MRQIGRRDPGAASSYRGLLIAVGAVVLTLAGVVGWYGLTALDRGLGRVGGDLHALLITDDGTIIYGQHAGIQVSDDGGRTWTAPSGTGDAMALAASPDHPDIIYQAGHDLLLISEDQGRIWREAGFGDLPGTDIHGFAIGPADGTLYANLAGHGLHLSRDQGRSWAFVAQETADALALAVGPGREQPLYALFTERGPVVSEDGGRTWSRIEGAPSTSMSGLHVHPSSGNLYLAGDGGVFRSRDRGASWEELGPAVRMALIAADAQDEQKLVAVALNGQVYRSDDGGSSWRE